MTQVITTIPPKNSKITPNRFIEIKGARANNLKNIDLNIPRNELVVVTGVSGSGKSTITMDTLFAEGQRRYVESLSSYARQFMGRMKKPDVDFIKGICPAIAIEQKVTGGNTRSTVGSMTEVYDYLRLLYARVGITYSPISGNPVKKHSVTDVIEAYKTFPEGKKLFITMPLLRRYEGKKTKLVFEILLQKGFQRLWTNGTSINIETLLPSVKANDTINENLEVLVDRLITTPDDIDSQQRLADSVLICFSESEGECNLLLEDEKTYHFNNRFELDGMEFLETNPQLFNYNNSYGCCRTCEGYGKVLGIDEDKVIPDKSLSLYGQAISCWKGEKGQELNHMLLQSASQEEIPIHVPYAELSREQRKKVWEGTKSFVGIRQYFKELEEHLYKIQNRVMLARYRGRTNCPECDGSRLRKEAGYIKINQTPIGDLLDLPIDQVYDFFHNLELDVHRQQIAERLLIEIKARLHTMVEIGLGYLTLNRVSNTLSGGETQRINLTRMLGSNLSNSMYILDEPSVGLHPHDTSKLIKVLRHLRDLGNTVIVVEHEEDVIKAADFLVDVGPGAGINGGHIEFAGNTNTPEFKNSTCLTASYINGTLSIPIPKRRVIINKLLLKNANKHNLKNISVQIPLNAITAVTGVSGSGKTTLIKDVLVPLLQDFVNNRTQFKSDQLTGDFMRLNAFEFVNQSPIGKSSRSNPVTYVKAFDGIRKLYSEQALSKIKGFDARHFSFNVDGGRCDACEGEGEQVVEMQFLADVHLICESCKGRRFKDEVLEVRYKDKNIFEVLELSVDEAIPFFLKEKDVYKRLKCLQDVGLGYVKLGQSSSSLSGGEAQRVKLASFLTAQNANNNILFIFDEPSTGLHFHDLNKLLSAFNALIEQGHSVLFIEHNLDLIKCADHVIDLGPFGGKNGGNLLYEGTPEGLLNCKESITGKFLKAKI